MDEIKQSMYGSNIYSRGIWLGKVKVHHRKLGSVMRKAVVVGGDGDDLS